MNKKVKAVIVIGLCIGLAIEGCSGENYWSGNQESLKNKFDLGSYPKSILTQEIKDSLSYMGNEERLAYDVYMNLYDYHKKYNNIEIKQFYNISTRSEVKHISIVQSLVRRYNLKHSDFTNTEETIVDGDSISPAKMSTMLPANMPRGVYGIQKIQDLYNTLYALGKNSQEDALKVGCMVEVVDVNDLNEYITQAQNSNAQDVENAFEPLRKGSYNHYWAFDKALKNIGVENGCYYEGDELLTNKEGVYPKNENAQKGKGRFSNRKSQGYGYGRGQGRFSNSKSQGYGYGRQRQW